MNKEYLHFLLAMLLLAGLGLGVGSCKDDDDKDNGNNGSEQQQYDSKQPAKMRFWNVVSQLADLDDYDADAADKTYLPTIGEEGEGHTRIVYTNDLASAASRFAALIGKDDDSFDPATDRYEWSDPAVGKLTYQKSPEGSSSLATVDVSIRQVPTLEQIVYRTPEQADENGSFSGTAYYRFGDVVKRKNPDGQTEYWICVRPAFGPEGKKESHWVSLSPLPEKNIWSTFEYGQKNPCTLPKGLGVNTEHMQNLAELLYAMEAPKIWEENIKTHDAPGLFSKGLRMFHDFSHKASKQQYHNQHFFNHVRWAWEEQKLYEKLFGFDTSSPEYKSFFSFQDGLHLLAEDNYWDDDDKDVVTLVEYTFANNVASAQKLNMHDMRKREVKGNQRNANSRIDINGNYTLNTPYLSNSYFFGDANPRYVIRHATGKELASDHKWDHKKPITGVEPVYVYNAYFYQYTPDHFRDLASKDLEVTAGGDVPQEQQTIAEFTGTPHYRIGDIYKDDKGAHWFCISSAGTYDKSPYSEFISFDGIETTESGAAATNLPTLRQVLRAMGYISYLGGAFNSNSGRTIPFFIYTNQNFVEHGKVNMSHLMHRVIAQWEDKAPRYDTHLYDIAYDDGSRKHQALCRLVINFQNSQNEYNYFFYTYYPLQPSAELQLYTAPELSKVPIHLQDLTNADMVKQYAEDAYARQPISKMTGGDGQTPRKPRTTTEAGATDVRNYFYDYDKWETFSYPTDMWGGPLLFFRYTRAYDRGDAEYAKTTVDGQVLSLFSSRKWEDDNNDEDFYLYDMKQRYLLLQEQVKTYHLNGVAYDFPTWQNVNQDW